MTASGGKTLGRSDISSNIFISYSRNDSAFVARLETALSAREKAVWLDIDDIAPGAKWREEIHLGLAGCDGVVFVMTPHSLSSEECGKELTQALELGKRVVPVLRQEPNGVPVREELASINWVKLRDDDDFDRGLDQLLEALDKDFEWVHEHTRLGLRAAEWVAHDRRRAYVLRGDDLRAAEKFLTNAAGKEPEPTAEQLEYVAASRAAARGFTRRLLGAVSFALVVAIALTVIAFIERDAARVAQQRAYSRQLAADAATQLGVDPELSVLLAAKAYDVSPTAESVDGLRQALVGSAIRMAVRPADGVSQASMTPDGATLVTVGRSDGAVRLWRYPGAKLLAALPGVQAVHGQMSVNPSNGRILLVDAAQGQARVFSGSRPVLPALGSGVTAAAWGGRGRYIVTGSRDGTVAIWNATTGSEISRADALQDRVVSVAMGDQPRVLAVMGASGLARVYDFNARRHFDLATGCKGGAGQLRLSPDVAPPSQPTIPDESRLVTFGATCAATLWNTQSGREVSNLPEWAIGVKDVAFSADGSRFVLAAQVAAVLSSSNGTQVGQYVAHGGQLNAVAIAPLSAPLPQGEDTATGGEAGDIRLWSSATPADTSTTILRANETSIGSLAFAAGGRDLVSVDGDGSAARVWSPAPWPTKFGGALSFGVLVASIGALTTDGRLALTETADDSIAVFAPHSGRVLVTLRRSRRLGAPDGGFADGGRVAWAVASHGLRAWRTGDGSVLPAPAIGGDSVRAVVPAVSAPLLALELQAPQGGPWQVGALDPLTGMLAPISPGKPDAVAVDGAGRLALLAFGRSVRVFDLRSARVTSLPVTGGHARATLVSISADGRRAVVAGSDFVDVFDLAARTLVGHPLAAGRSPVTAVALTGDGTLVAAGYRDLQARLWRVADGRLIVTVKEGLQPTNDLGIGSVQISRDGNFLLTSQPGSIDTEIWDIASGSLLYQFDGSLVGASDDAHTVLTTNQQLETWTCDVCVAPSALRALARARVTRGFSHDEQAKFLTG